MDMPSVNTSTRPCLKAHGEQACRALSIFDGNMHSFDECPYLNRGKRPQGWKGTEEVWRKFTEAVDNPKDKRGGAMKGTLQRLKITINEPKQRPANREIT